MSSAFDDPCFPHDDDNNHTVNSVLRLPPEDIRAKGQLSAVNQDGLNYYLTSTAVVAPNGVEHTEGPSWPLEPCGTLLASSFNVFISGIDATVTTPEAVSPLLEDDDGDMPDLLPPDRASSAPDDKAIVCDRFDADLIARCYGIQLLPIGREDTAENIDCSKGDPREVAIATLTNDNYAENNIGSDDVAGTSPGSSPGSASCGPVGVSHT
ncbi:hypothetical protein AURDEDRAFT_160858 [Auricularia subglabra TFB-10046 SS5]|nr:hypothetical protein AURDEDRAFT_160858 [Auricularia subglabra TFB-10046 SS5]